MTISPYRYPGSKNKLLPVLMPYLDSLLANSDVFVEPFVGGGSVVLEVARKYPKLKLFINDSDQWIASFWTIVAGDRNGVLELLNALPSAPDLKTFQTLSKEPTEGILEAAVKAIFFNRTTFSGLIKRNNNGEVISSPIGGAEQKSKWKVDCRYNYQKLKQKILNCHQLLTGRTEVCCVDFSQYEPLTKTDFPAYIDPPYVKAGKLLYSEFMMENQHQKLGDILLCRKNWILSYDNDELIKNIYKNCDISNINSKYCINGTKKVWSQKSEFIITPKL